MRPPTFIRSRGVAWTLAALVSTSLIVTPVHGVGPAHADDFDDDGDNEGFEAGERFYALGARYTKFKGYSKALTFFKKALPYMNEESGIYYNLVSVSEALNKSAQVFFYASAFLRIEPDGPDSREMGYKLKKAASTLRASRRPPAEVRFDVDPPGTPLFVNMVPVGDSGGPPVSLPPGTYTVTGTIDDYHPFEREFRVSPRTPVTVSGAFEKIKYYGHLEVKVFEAPCAWPCTALQAALDQADPVASGLKEAEGVRVYINDAQVGQSPMDKLKLLSDRYLVRFERDGWDSWSRYVKVGRNETFLLQPILEKTASK